MCTRRVVGEFKYKFNIFFALDIYKFNIWLKKRYSDWKEVCIRNNALNELASNGTDLVFFNIANSFFGAKPRNKFLAKSIERIMRNIQSSDYTNAWYETGPMMLLDVFKEYYGEDYEKHFAGNYRVHTLRQPFVSKDGHWILYHKCDGCGKKQGRKPQDWERGNNYIEIFEKHHFYCEDSASLFGGRE